MSRRKTPDKTPKASSGARSMRSRERRERRKDNAPDPTDLTWLVRSGLRMAAMKVINAYPERPYWLSIPHGQGDGIEPVAGFIPCSSFRTKKRAYYGFLFREHREALIEKWDNARRETGYSMSQVNRNA